MSITFTEQEVELGSTNTKCVLGKKGPIFISINVVYLSTANNE